MDWNAICHREPRHAVLLSTAVLVATVLAGCGAGSTGDDASSTDSNQTTEPGSPLHVRLSGTLEGRLFCSATLPCWPLDDLGIELVANATEPDAFVEVLGTVDSKGLHVDEATADPFALDGLLEWPDRCGTEPIPARGDTAVLEQLDGYIATIPDTFATMWISDTDRAHLGVIGDLTVHATALGAMPLADGTAMADHICVAGSFPTTAVDRQVLQQRLVAEVGPVAGATWSAGANPVTGMIDFDTPMADASTLEALARIREGLNLRAPIQILDGRVDDYESVLAIAGVDPDLPAERLIRWYEPAEMRLRDAPAPGDTTLHLVAAERSCAAGRTPAPDEVRVLSEETDTEVNLLVLVERPVGDQTCPGNPSIEMDIPLRGPVGDRAVVHQLDGTILEVGVLE